MVIRSVAEHHQKDKVLVLNISSSFRDLVEKFVNHLSRWNDCHRSDVSFEKLRAEDDLRTFQSGTVVIRAMLL